MKLLLLILTLFSFSAFGQGAFVPIGDTGASNFYAVPTMNQGSLITSDGTNNGEFSACPNGQILEWDDAEVSGVKCVAKPTASSETFDQEAITADSGFFSTTSSTEVAALNQTVTTNGAVSISFRGSNDVGWIRPTGSASCVYSVYRDSTLLNETRLDILDHQAAGSSLNTIDLPTDGSHTYQLRVKRTAGSVSCAVSNIAMAIHY